MEVRCCGEIFDGRMAPARQVVEPGMGPDNRLHELLVDLGYRRSNHLRGALRLWSPWNLNRASFSFGLL